MLRGYTMPVITELKALQATVTGIPVRETTKATMSCQALG